MRKTKLFGWLLGIALCACMVLWMPVSADAADSVETDCSHEWVDGTCSACGEVCAHTSFDDNGFCAVCDFGQPAVDADGDGYVDIANAGNLYWLRYAVNIQKNYSLNAELTADIVINENVNVSDGRRTWKAIGGNNGFYSGIFDGNGYTISGLYSNGSALFCDVKDGIIRNVGIIDCYIFTRTDSAAAIADYISDTSRVENCFCTGGEIRGKYEVGSIVARCGGTVINCYNTSDVGGIYGGDACGGIVGELYSGGSILNCYNTGKINAGASTRFYGGIVGDIYMDAGKVDNCYYLNTTWGTGIGGADSAGKANSMTAEQFASGEVAYLLGDAFGQTIGTDALPVLGGQKVYKGTNCKNETVYSNTELNGAHQWINDFCTVCGTMDITSAVASTTVGGTTTYHLTLDAAIQAVKDCTAEDEAVVKLLKNIDQGSSYQEITSGVFTLDLNGKTLKSVGKYVLCVYRNGVDVTIEDTGVGGTINGSNYGVYAYWNCTLTIGGGTITGSERGIYASGCKVFISGGTITGKYAVRTASNSTVTISGGTIRSNVSGVYADNGTVIINNGSINGGPSSDGVYASGCKIIVSGGSISGGRGSVYASNCATTISDGTFSGEVNANGGSLKISGGSISGGIYCLRAEAFITVTISGGTLNGVFANQSTVNISGGSISGSNYGVYASTSTLNISGGSISGSGYDIYTRFETVVKLSLGENGVGATFPGGIEVQETTLNAILGEGAAYWQNGKQITVADGTTEITGGDVVVKAYVAPVYSGWTEINGDWYYYDPGTNEPVTGIVRVPYPAESINGIAYGPNAEDVAYYENKGQTFIDKNSALFVFDENGVFQSDLNGLTGDNRWASNGCIIWHIGLVQAGEDYYYFLGDAVNGGNQMATGDVHVGRNTTDMDAVLGGVYTFGEDGKLCKYDGIVDLRYYENYRLMLGNGLTKVGEYYIYVRSSGELAVDCEYYVPGNDLGIAPGTYTFDENGFLVEPISSEKNGVYFENGAWYYYENGKIGYNKGLTAHGDGYIYVRSSGKLATGAYYITNVPEELSGLFRVGQKVIFNENGIADAPKHGIVDGYYYQYGAVRYNAGLIQVDGKWIYVRSNGALATGRYWVTNTNGATEAGYYEFDKNGYMIISEIEDGIVVEGENLYYYLDGKKQFGLGLVMLEDGSYIYVRTGGELAVGSYWITNHNGLLIEGMYEFSQDGTLTIN